MSEASSASKKRKGLMLSWLILALSVSVTVILWHETRENILKGARADFDFRVEEIKQAIVHRMRGYEQV